MCCWSRTGGETTTPDEKNCPRVSGAPRPSFRVPARKGSGFVGCVPANLRIPSLCGRRTPVPDARSGSGCPGRFRHGSCSGGLRRTSPGGGDSRRTGLWRLDHPSPGPGDPKLHPESLPNPESSGSGQIGPGREERALSFPNVFRPDPACVPGRPLDGRRQDPVSLGLLHKDRASPRSGSLSGGTGPGMVRLSHGNPGSPRRKNLFRRAPGDRPGRRGNIDNRLGGERCAAINREF